MRKITTLLLSGLFLLFCSACRTNDEEMLNAENDSENTIIETEIFWNDNVKSRALDRMLPLPDSWDEIAIVETPAAVEGEYVILFRLYEKIAYETDGTGLVWVIGAQTREDFTSLREDFLESEGVDIYKTCYGQANYAIGYDKDYIYILALPTDVQYLTDDNRADESYESRVNYAALVDDSQAVLTVFMEKNGIIVNPSCQSSDCYSPGG